ncbi:leucine-rich repeat domain-containing protein [Tenacibaculum sp.]|uniref:leucine-rich repeat domain-containing protein n=1 Tax=Tenacibaculum sp. TaxID=1906242 RepID=UPI003D14059C
MKRLLLFTLVLFGVYVNAQEISQSDKDALIALYNATDGANWTNKWDLNDSPQNWYGVKTNVVFGASGAERHVDEINLPNNNLVGTLPSELGSLKSLNVLNLSNNSISGAIPGGLGYAKDLNYLYLQNNQLSGDIPVELFTLTERHFVEINLSSNLLTGKLPVEIGNAIANVGDVYVSNNLLTDLPDYTASTLFRIKTLDVSNNNIPFAVFERASSFDNIAKVLEDNVATLTYSPQNKINEEENIVFEEGTNVSFSVTGLSSTNNTYQWFNNSASITGATSATYQITSASLADAGTYYCEIQNPSVPNLTLKRNNIVYRTVESISDKNALIAFYNTTDGANWTDPWDLNADISIWKGVTTNAAGRVTELNLSNRGLNGTLPVEIGNLSELKRLFLYKNQLTGIIPLEIKNLTNLTYLWLNSNNLNGVVPEEIGDLTNLESLDLSYNELMGSIPSAIENLTSLTSLNLRTNKLTGNIPSEIGNLIDLTSLILSSNQLTGVIPTEIGNLTNLRNLWLYKNKLTGSVPLEIRNLINLKKILLDNNELTGSIPSEIGNLINLTDLSLSSNQLTGSIPTAIGNITNLTSLNFSTNKLTGNIPSEIGNLISLTSLNLGFNQLTGVIPSEIGNLINLKVIYLGHNKLTGGIPLEITMLSNLESVILRYNELTGVIPSEIGNLINLTDLILSSNQLTGSIPSEIGNLTKLINLTLDGNQLTGKIPVIFKDMINLSNLSIHNNSFTFVDLEDNFLLLKDKLRSYDYHPQSDIGVPEVHNIDQYKSITFTVNSTSNNNNYQWKFKGENIIGATNKSYTLNSVTTSDIGEYNCIITNSIVSGLILSSEPITLNVNIIDTDNDGVNDDIDKCLDTPAGESVNVDGCSDSQLDDDNDGVNNAIDLCLNTPIGAIVNEKGCSENNSDKEALIALYNATDGVNWTETWDLNAQMSTWKGVVLDTYGNVTKLDLYFNNLNGMLPSEIGNLTSLIFLNISSNKLIGEIPPEIGNLINLKKLSFSNNQLSGVIPKEIGKLTFLEELSLGGNQLTGAIPIEVTNLTKLRDISLSQNQLSGEIPKEIGKLTFLEKLSLYTNQLIGDIPLEIGNLTNLTYLNIANNKLTGAIPKSIGNLIKIQNISIGTNQLTGEIPLEIGNLTNLRFLYLFNNQLTGEIPSEIGNLVSLEYISLNSNNLTGIIPGELGNLINLEFLMLEKNKLSGFIPFGIENLVKLRWLSLAENELTGIIPIEIGNLINLEYLSLDKNNLSGPIPSEFGNLNKLESAYLRGNQLSGKIPSTIKDMDSFDILVIENNNFVFKDLEDEFLPIKNKLKHYVYDSQAHLDVSKEITVKQNESITFSVEGTSSPNNIYTWRLNGKNILNTKDKTFTISKADIDDNGVYDCLITNSVVTNLTLIKKPITLNVEIIDADNDGVNDDIDQCPNTVEGSVVDANGCAQYQLIDIAPSDIQVMVNSTTCPDKSNGIVNLLFKKDYTYKVILVGQDVINKTFENVNYTSGLKITELPVGSYEICVTASELPSFSQCYNVMVSTPAALKVSQKSLTGTSITYQVSGSESYKVTVNSNEYSYSFKDAGKQEITVNLDSGSNSVEITTNKPCQGVYNKSIIVNGITLYPIPVTNYLNISGVTDNTAMVTVRSLEGATVLSTKLDVYNGVAKLPMDTLATGMYLVTVTTSTQTVNTKIFKK